MAQGLRDCGWSLEGEAFTWEEKQILSIHTGEAGPKHKIQCGATLRIFPEWFSFQETDMAGQSHQMLQSSVTCCSAQGT